MRLSKIQIDDFNRDGYVFLPKLFSDLEVRILSAELPSIFSLDREEIERDETSGGNTRCFRDAQIQRRFCRLASPSAPG